MTELVADNAEKLETAFRDRSPFCNYEPALPFSVESIENAYRTGNAVYLNGKPSLVESRVHSLFESHLSLIESLTIASGTGNTVELQGVDLSPLTNLRSLYIEEHCFLFTIQFLIHDLHFLRSIHIERFCFFVTFDMVENSRLFIQNCSNLESVFIGSSSFFSYSSLKLESGRM